MSVGDNIKHFSEAQRKVMSNQSLNFTEQDFDALAKVFQKQKKRLWDELGSEHIADIHHIGSTAIKGMPGVPAIDMILFIHTWPPTEAVYKGLDKLGFITMGDAPHYANDKFFVFLGSPESGLQELGSGAVHVVHDGNKDAFEKQILWAEYCNNNKEAFEAYKQIKLEAKECGTIMEYKRKKGQMLQALFPKALEWKKQQMAENK